MRVHHVESNILQNNFYSAIKVEILRFGRNKIEARCDEGKLKTKSLKKKHGNVKMLKGKLIIWSKY